MQITLNFGRWTTLKAALAVGAALAIGGVVGSAVAIGPTIDVPIKWSGGWEAASSSIDDGDHEIYAVPAGKSLLVTDVFAANTTTTNIRFLIYAGNADCDDITKYRTYYIPVAPNAVVHLPLQTGIGFGAGQEICVDVIGANLNFHARGFLFTPAPAS